MAERKEIKKARDLGYEVNAIRPENDVYHVDGFGLSTYYSADDDEPWESLISGHDERKKQFEMTPEERDAYFGTGVG